MSVYYLECHSSAEA
ncbi:uncharacterized protein FFM5_04988 [Fusarium fujikuroi]|nr:uncharacterized protein FFM5_04988 [Fusarium fujikuroi]